MNGEPLTDRLTGTRLSSTLAAGAFVLAFLTHYEVLSYWFTGPDTLTLIETSRIVDSKSAIDTLTKPLMHGTNFVVLTGLFYRPVASLSYAVDYWVWGLDPFGYHLTDLLAHATAAALLVVLVAEQFGVERSVEERSGGTGPGRARTIGFVTAVIAGGLFALHPLTAEVVPVPARRHDVLATVFALASLWALARGLRASRTESRTHRAKYLALSLLAYALALGSKEVSAILPALAVTWTALDTYGESGELVRVVRKTAVVGIGYAVVSLLYLWLRLSLLGGIGGYVGPFGGVKDTPIPVIVVQYFLSLFYPVDVLDLGAGVEYVPATLYVVLAVWAGLFLFGIVGAGGLRPFLRGRAGRLAVFYSLWLCLPLPLIARVGEYSPWTGYVALVPVAALGALVATVGARGSFRALAGLAAGEGGPERVRAGVRIGGNLATLALASVLVCSLVAVSPLVHPYDGWEHAGEVTEDALIGAERSAAELPPEAVVKVEGLPTVVTLGPPTAEPRVKSLRYFWAHSVRSWVHLRDPGSRLSTFTHGITTPVGNGSVAVRVETTPRPNAPPVMRFHYESRSANEPNEPTEPSRIGTRDRRPRGSVAISRVRARGGVDRRKG